MSRRAWLYVIGVMFMGLFSAIIASAASLHERGDWTMFAVILVLTTVAQLFKVLGPTHEAYHINLVFLFAGIFLVTPFQYALLVIVPHLIEWAKERLLKTPSLRNWYIQPFNIAVHLTTGLTVRALLDVLNVPRAEFTTFQSVVVAFVCAGLYVVLNHLLIGEAMVLARRVSWRESGVLNTPNILTNLVLLLLGYTVAIVWSVNPWLVLPALSPLVLMYRALNIPKLTKDAQTDAKTGLWNARHFVTLYEAEIEKAVHTEHSLALLMTDLDLLRNINNTYGHLAGDAVLAGVARLIRENTRAADIAGRFGGEEFCIALPETTAEQALAIAERLRARVQAAEYSAGTLAQPIHATISIGLACFPNDAQLPFDLIHKADIAVYRAKLVGRNCVVNIADLPDTTEIGIPSGEERVASAVASSFVPRPVPSVKPGDRGSRSLMQSNAMHT